MIEWYNIGLFVTLFFVITWIFINDVRLNKVIRTSNRYSPLMQELITASEDMVKSNRILTDKIIELKEEKHNDK